MTRRLSCLTAVAPLVRGDPIKPIDQARLLTLKELAELLRVSRSKVECDVAAGLPHLDVGTHSHGRRVKRSLRFSWPTVVDWYKSR